MAIETSRFKKHLRRKATETIKRRRSGSRNQTHAEITLMASSFHSAFIHWGSHLEYFERVQSDKDLTT